MRRFWLIPALALLVACGDQATTPSVGDEAFELPADQVMFFATSTLTQAGVRRSELTADTVFMFEQSRQLSLLGVKLVFYDDSGREAGTLTSDEGDHDTAASKFTARGNVVLITTNPEGGERRLETEELFFDIEGDRIWSEKPFTLYEDGQTTSGSTFRSDGQFRTWEVTGARTEGTVGGGGITF